MSGDRPTESAVDPGGASTSATGGDGGATPALGPAADRASREPGDLAVALSPRQVIGGFALVAGLIVWLVRRARRKG